jgi:hypothetical protein
MLKGAVTFVKGCSLQEGVVRGEKDWASASEVMMVSFSKTFIYRKDTAPSTEERCCCLFFFFCKEEYEIWAQMFSSDVD